MSENINDIAKFQLSGMRRQANELLMAAFKRGYFHGKVVEENGGWVSVEDHLPSNGIGVLVCDDNGKILSGLMCINGEWQWPNCGVKSAHNIVAWMPLPKPYKAEEESPKTRAEKFYEMFPNCVKLINATAGREIPPCCWRNVVGEFRDCVWLSEECYDCWDEPYNGEFEGEEGEQDEG